MPRCSNGPIDTRRWCARWREHGAASIVTTLFYLTWIDGQRSSGDGTWLKRRAGPRFRAWSGLAFENLCLRHVDAIKRALGIGAVETEDAPWVHRPADAEDQGAQIDLVIDRAGQSINLCEMKFAESEFVLDKMYARELELKRDVFRRVTGTRFPDAGDDVRAAPERACPAARFAGGNDGRALRAIGILS